MTANAGVTFIWGSEALHYLRQPIRLFQSYQKRDFRADIVAGITVAVIALPQAIAFAVIAELPPQMGLYAAIVGAIAGALWGVSQQAHYGPANAISLLVAAALSESLTPGTSEFIIAAGLMAVMVGAFQLLMGLFRLGLLVNFVSHSVTVGFAAGAGILIIMKQIGPLIGVALDTTNLFTTLHNLSNSLPLIHWATFWLGAGTILTLIFLNRFRPQAPGPLIVIVVTTFLAITLNLDEQGVVMIGEIPRNLPPITSLPLLDLPLVARLSTGALAVGAIGLVQTSAIIRSIASQTGQRVDNNQEFVAQGMANLAAGIFSGYACAASFSRTAVNYRAGARSPMAAVFSGLFVLFAMLVLAPLAVYLPVAALAGILIITAYGMIDKVEIKRIWQGTRGDALIMLVTLLGTLFLNIEFAVLAGIMFSFARYILRTSLPRVHTVVPDATYSHFEYAPERSACPQLGIIDIEGDLYFGAVNHIEETILNLVDANPEQRYLLIRMTHVNHCDFSGIHMLESVLRACRDRGGDLFLVRVNERVRSMMHNTHFDEHLGFDHYLSEDEAIAEIFHRVLDPAVCIYECPVKVFKECQNLPKRIDLAGIPLPDEVPDMSIFHVSAHELWELLHQENGERPYVVDVREPREFRRGHIPEANLAPLPRILTNDYRFPNDRQIVLVCRSGRRSRRAAFALQKLGIVNVFTLAGGMQAWEAGGLLTAVDQFL